MERQEKIWWNSIAGPASLKNAIVNAISERKNICLMILEDTPWRHHLRYSVEEEAKTNEYEISIIDYSDEISEQESLLRYLIRKFGNPNVSSMFRDGVMKPYKFIIEHKIMENKVVWVKGIPDHLTKQVSDELASYSSATSSIKNAGIILLELRSTTGKAKSIKNTEFIKYEDYITVYDTLLFSYLISSQLEIRDKNLQAYLAHLSSELCGYDSETCFDFLQCMDIYEQDPKDAIVSIFERSKESGRGIYEEGLLIQHPFYHIKEGKMEDIERRIWKAQVQVFFPYIEQQRIGIIEKWKANIQACLPRNDSFGNTIENALDVELGLLLHLALGKLEPNEVRFVTDYDTGNRIKFLHKLRNKLAHLDLCSVDEILKLCMLNAERY